MKILIADDDKELCHLLNDYLSQEGFQVEMVYDGESAIRATSKRDYDLMILDVMMPQKNGFEALGEIRQRSDLPVIMLTARGEKIDRIVGLEMGADDYVAKPCDPRELVARIRAVTRRTQQLQSPKQETTKFDIDGLHLDLGNRQVLLNGEAIECTTTEFEILGLLVRKAGTLVTKETISEVCLGKKLQAFDRSIDMHLSNLRKKLGDLSAQKPRIKTVRGSGYQYLVWGE
ncbi:response regulator transcription factor [Aliikangiella marina]|uniref:Response regulator transcription factor n=1 Tax=Aliikangiella marina TaxID=1712262 RepID=A0A545T965_9GAMM|nr:response regulator transcription factor [Aliikangiella marina]TQV73735.1 response regulator transcription factor [Aliikangiella marina]